MARVLVVWVLLSAVVPFNRVPWFTTSAGRQHDVARLAAALDAPDAESRGRAACMLREAGDRAVTAIKPLLALLADAALIQALRDPEPGVREQVAWSLGTLDATAAVPSLMSALKDQDVRVRRQAAWALGAIGK